MTIKGLPDNCELNVGYQAPSVLFRMVPCCRCTNDKTIDAKEVVAFGKAKAGG